MHRPGMISLLAAAAVLAVSGSARAQLYPAQYGWLDSLSQGKALARQTGKPLFVVFRCQP